MTPMMPDMDVLAHVAPLINTILLVILVLAAPVVWLQLRKATPLAIRAEVDLVTRSMGELRRAQKELERELGAIHHEKKQTDLQLSSLHARITDVSESIANRLDGIHKSLDRLACSEQNWHTGERPSFCPLHRQECPLNVDKKDEPK